MRFISPNKSFRPEYHLRLLDLGGGFPWPFGTSDTPVDISALREKLQRVNAQRRLTADAQLWFESGRYLVASCGTLLSTVLDVKVSLGGKTHIILDTGMIHLGGMAGLGRIYRAVASIEPLAGPDGEATPVRRRGGSDGLRAGLRRAR